MNNNKVEKPMSTTPPEPEQVPVSKNVITWTSLIVFIIALPVGGFSQETNSAIAISALSLGLSITLFITVWNRSVRWRIVGLLVGFLALLFCFATGHYTLYLKNRLNYYFSQSIQDERFFNDFDSQFKEVRHGNEMLLYLAAVDDYSSVAFQGLQKRVDFEYGKSNEFLKSEDNYLPLGRGYSFRFGKTTHQKIIDRNYSIPINDYTFQLKGSGGTRTINTIDNSPSSEAAAVIELSNAKDLEAFRIALLKLVGVKTKERDDQMERLEKLAQGSQWGFVDFCYFSTVTMTTVGYGDILPNSRHARLLA